MTDPAVAADNDKLTECKQWASSSVQPATKNNTNGGKGGGSIIDSINNTLCNSNNNNAGNASTNNHHHQGAAVGIGSGTGGDSGNNVNGNLQQKMPGSTNAAIAMGAASLAPPLLVMQHPNFSQHRAAAATAAAAAAVVQGGGGNIGAMGAAMQHPGMNNPHNLLYPNPNFLSHNNNNNTFVPAQAQASMLNMQMQVGTQQQQQQAWQQYCNQQQRSFGMNSSAFSQQQQQHYQQQHYQQQQQQQQQTNRGVATIQNSGSGFAGYYGGLQLATNRAVDANTTIQVAAGFAPIGGTAGGSDIGTTKKKPKPDASQKRNWNKVITNKKLLCLPTYMPTEKPPEDAKPPPPPPPPPSLTAATTTDASKLELSYVLSLKNDDTKLFGKLNFENCDISMIDAIFPFKYDSKSKQRVGPHHPPREWRNNARRIREWRRFGKKSQEAIIAKIDGGHTSLAGANDNDEITFYSPRGGGGGGSNHRRLRCTSFQRPLVRKHVLRPRQKISIIEPIFLKRKAPPTRGGAAINKKPKSGAIHLLNGKDRARNLNNGVPPDDFIFKPAAIRPEPNAAVAPAAPAAAPKEPPKPTYKYLTCQGITLDHLRARARLESSRDDTIKGFGHCIGEAMHTYATAISNQQDWLLDPRLYQGAIFSSKNYEVMFILRLRDDYQQHSAQNQQYGFISPSCAGVFASCPDAGKPAAGAAAANNINTGKPVTPATAPTTGKPAAAKKSTTTTISVGVGMSSVAATGKHMVGAIEIFEDPGCCQACRSMCQRFAERCKSTAQRRAKPTTTTSAPAARYQQLQSSQTKLLNQSKLKGQRLDLTNSPTELRQIIQERYDIQRNTTSTLRRLTKKMNAKKDEEETGGGGDGGAEHDEKKSEVSKQANNKHQPRVPAKMGK